MRDARDLIRVGNGRDICALIVFWPDDLRPLRPLIGNSCLTCTPVNKISSIAQLLAAISLVRRG